MALPPRLVFLFRPVARKGIWHWVRFALFLALGSYVGHVLSDNNLLTDLRYKLYYRQLSLPNRGNGYPRRVALVLLNDDDYWGQQFQARTPLRRDLLAKLLNELDRAQVNVMALDVDLRSPLPKKPNEDFPAYLDEDRAFFREIGELCQHKRHLVLATSIDYVDDNYVKTPSLYDKALAQESCVTSGYIQLPYDMRRIPGSLPLANGQPLDSLSLALTKLEDPSAYQVAAAGADDDRGFRFSQYLTEKDFDPRDGRRFFFSAAEVGNMTPQQLHEQLGDRMVLIGAKWHADCACEGGAYVDTHDSPGGTEPGVMLHANYVEAMLDRSGTFTPITDGTAEAIEIGLVILLALVSTLEIHTGWKFGAFLAGIVFSIGLTYMLLQNLGLFLDFAIPLLMILGHTLVEEFVNMALELREHERKAHALHEASTGAHTE